MKNQKLTWLNIAPLLPGYETENAADLRQMFADGIITETAFCMTLVPEGQPAVDKAAILGERFVRYRDALGRTDMPVGILLQATMGHGWVPNVPTPFQRMVKEDGVEPYTFCPLGEPFRDYIRKMIFSLAGLKPDFFMLDDDTRLISGRNGCYCPLHVARFNQENGTNHDRESLRQAVYSDRRTALAYWRLQRDSMAEFAALIRSAINEADPAIPCSFCTCSDDIQTAVGMAQTLAAPGDDLLIRINHGRYLNESLWNTPAWMQRTAYQVQHVGKRAKVLAEPDTCPHNNYSTSAAMLHAHITGSLIEGCKGGKLWITRLGHYEPDSGKRYREKLRQYNGFYRTIGNLDVNWDGVTTLLPPKDFIPFPPTADNATYAPGWHDLVLGKMGIPIHFCGPEDLPEKGATIALCGREMRFHKDQDLEKILKNHNVLLDGLAAEKLTERGFANLIGVSADANLPKCATIEYCSEDKKDYVQFTVGCSMLKPLPGTECLSAIWHKDSAISPEEEYICPGLTVYTNPQGGKIAVLAAHLFGTWEKLTAFSCLNEVRKRQLLQIFEKFGGVPWTMPGDDHLVLRCGTTTDGEYGIIYAVDTGLDEVDHFSISGKNAPDITAVEELMPDGSWQKIPYAVDGETIRLEKTLYPLRPFVARLCHR